MQLGHSPPSSIPSAHAHAADGRVFIPVTGEAAPMGFNVTYMVQVHCDCQFLRG